MTNSQTDAAPRFVTEGAPFTAEQRNWLNGLLAELFTAHAVPLSALTEFATTLASPASVQEDMPWHKQALSLDERMMLAHGRPLGQRLMAAMGQQDCRQCGYDCKTYADAVSSSSETRLNLCVPGGKDTTRMLAALLAEMAGGTAAFDADAYGRVLSEKNAPLAPETREGYCRDRPVPVHLKSRRPLNEAGSEGATYHIEIDLEATGIGYTPGDAFGLYPENDPVLVDAVIAAIGAAADFPIGGRTLRESLIKNVSLGTPPDSLFELIACLTGGEQRRKAKCLARGEDLDGDARTLDVLAALEKFPGVTPHPEAFVESLDRLQPRLYSIASSLSATPGHVALTVNHVCYSMNGRVRHGVASSFLSARAAIGSTLKAYVQQAPHFRLPQSDDTPIIMVGPGTGIAPFRAFLQERRARAAQGRNWLFFGHRNEARDFLYAEELEEFSAVGVLNRLSLAWSRDGETKTYVQHKMIEEGEELWDWLYDGAHIYVCGDAARMAPDVERALVEIIADHGNRDDEAAADYVENLKKSSRYQKDVY